MSENTILVSLIIPTYNRNGQLKECLQTISKMDFPKAALEVIIVNDGGGEFDAELDRLIHKWGYLKYNQKNGGPASARNHGAEHANGVFLAFIDDDCFPSADWLTSLLSSTEQMEDGIIGGKVVNALNDNIYSSVSQMILTYLYSEWDKKRSISSFFTTNNMIIPKNLFDEVGGFDAGFRTSEDRDFCTRWQLRGYPMKYNGEAIVFHQHELNLKSFWSQQYNYGKGLFQFNQKFEKTTHHKRHFESLSFYWNLLVYPFRHKSIFTALKLSILIVISQVAIFSGYLLSHFTKVKTHNV